MSKDIAIRVEGLGKRYQLGETVDLQRDLRETLMALPRMFARGVKRRLTESSEERIAREFWAVRDVSFKVNRGEAVGIIGGNGAGKSTLLKLLSRITTPTTGHAEIRGRVGSLLEVGTGFNPELTGRENIYLNGSILGMRKAEIARKFDEIVDFSGVEKFLDTPVKRYSSGMRVRLGFAVAAHLEPEILIVDEVLSVGDAEFRKKCLGKMEDVAEGGRTVLFVSHNLGAISRLCSKTVLMDGGQLAGFDETSVIVNQYISSMVESEHNRIEYPVDEKKHAQILSIALCDQDGELHVGPYKTSDPIQMKIHADYRTMSEMPRMAFYLQHFNGERVLFSDVRDHEQSFQPANPGEFQYTITIPAPLLCPGDYSITVGIAGNSGHLDHHANVLNFSVVEVGATRTSRPGYIYMPLEWSRADGA